MQDHGARERALMESKAELQKRLYESMIKPQACDMLLRNAIGGKPPRSPTD